MIFVADAADIVCGKFACFVGKNCSSKSDFAQPSLLLSSLDIELLSLFVKMKSMPSSYRDLHKIHVRIIIVS